MGILEKINEIEQEMARTQKNKKTEYHIGCLKARLAKLRKELLAPKQKQSGDSFEVQKLGDARVTLIGFPSVGKSTMLSKLTSTESKQAAYEFTTLDCVSGKLNINGATIQILDLPGIIKGAAQGIGRGRQVIAVARTSDLILMVLDPRRHEDKEVLTQELGDMGIRLNKRPPNVSFTIKNTGGVSINSTLNLTKLDENMIRLVLKEYKINNCLLVIREDIDVEDLIDVISKVAVYIPCIYVYNKIDSISYEKLCHFGGLESSVMISSRMEWNFDELLDEIWDVLSLKRVYTKRRGEFPSFEDPLVLRGSSTVKQACLKIHKDFIESFKYALVWGASAKHQPQKVGLNHELSDEDVIQIYTS